MKKGFFKILLILMLCIVLSGCGDKVNKDSALYKAKENMVDNVDNYNMDINITVVTDFGNVDVDMNCHEDRKNEITYCKSNTLGVGTEDYTDNKNKYSYSKVYDDYGMTVNEWTKTKLQDVKTDQWLGLNDYIFDLKEETVENGTKYTGIIELKKLLGMLENMDLPIDALKILNKDIEVEVVVDNENYIDTMKFNFNLMGIDMIVEIDYNDYNNAGDIVIPEEVLNAKEVTAE